MLKSAIDTRRLIDEVQKRPILYNGKGAGSDSKRDFWEEVAKEIFTGSWGASDGEEQAALVKEVQGKWRCVRDAYARCRRERGREKPGMKKRKYLYYDKLRFLDSNIISRPKEGTSRPSRASDPADNNIFFMVDDSSNYIAENDEVSISGEDCGGGGDDTTSSQPGASSASTPSDKIALLLKELVNMQKESRSGDKMGNKSFLLSLLPFFEKLTDDVNMELRLQIMSVVQTYASQGESLMKP